MNFVISTYDNLLIFYPNVFFAALFLLVFLIGIFLLQTITYVSTLGFIEEVKSYGYLLKPRKVNMGNYPIIMTEKLIYKGVCWLRRIEIWTVKIIKRIGKEILIDEKK